MRVDDGAGADNVRRRAARWTLMDRHSSIGGSWDIVTRRTSVAKLKGRYLTADRGGICLLFEFVDLSRPGSRQFGEMEYGAE